jgi:hypothetical protein
MLVRAADALAVVRALLAVLRFGLRASTRTKGQAGRGFGNECFVRVIETTLLSHGAMLDVIRSGDAYHVVGVTQGRLTPDLRSPFRGRRAHSRLRGDQRAARLSNHRGGTSYTHPGGYDFRTATISASPSTVRETLHAIWGAGASYTGPGATWTRERR